VGHLRSARSVAGWDGGAGEVAVFEAVGVAFEGEDLGVVDEPVDHGGGDDVVAEDLAPAREGLVGRDDQAGALVRSVRPPALRLPEPRIRVAVTGAAVCWRSTNESNAVSLRGDSDDDRFFRCAPWMISCDRSRLRSLSALRRGRPGGARDRRRAGLGQAIAVARAHAGADVALGLRDAASGKKLVGEMEGFGRRPLAMQMDVSRLPGI